jgi:outer membrane lipoprotein-sorting protein
VSPWLRRLAAAGLLAMGLAPGLVQAQDARTILLESDRVRFPQEGFEMDAVVQTFVDGKPQESRGYRILSRGNDNTIVMVTEPASERGQIMLMKGRDLWIFLPDVSQPVRLSLAQRLTGQVANGDLARANFSGDYNPAVLRSETLDNEPHWVLELTGVDRGVTYQKVLYWVKQSNYFPAKAEFYSASGRLLKTCRYENFQTMAGRLRPTRLVMRDALRSEEESTLEYSRLRLRDLPEKVFNKDYLKRLQ